MYKNILIPVALDHDGGIEKALAAARELADASARVTVMHVIETIPGYVRGQIPEEVLEARRAEMKKTLAGIAAKMPGATAQLVTGHAGQTIVNFADDHGVDCIILSSHKPGISDFFIGSTANRVVHHAKCSVHVIR